ncbi:MAG: choice-of-anchor D domain-containing protein [Bacteroidota bacterium]|nr:choice-of-anchor D domain-containing protein [Bacteroidota bacterium]MDP4234128.1 choice-of-anchor D domain-containing protein [Bacteroidota bacterium]MDP4243069.1 choice-of-anchor D domain-containing protein [Bacteroidota bacterium]MDP4287495.1 choice-of-anchor D domain-containing protein [Bacteroidota bacterium]
MPNSFSLGCCPPQGVTMYIGSGTDNEVWIDVFGGNQNPSEHYHTKMLANSVWTVAPTSEASWETLNPAEVIAYRAIHVYSAKPIVIYGYQYTGANTSSTDSYLGLPTPALGTEYYPSCYYDDHYTLGPSNPLAGQFLIISPYDNNVVTIGPVKTDTREDAAATKTLHFKGDVWNVTLQRGQTYLVQSTGLGYGDEDITGTHIVSTKPIALISGHQLCSIPIGELADQNGSKDEIFEMIPPVSVWGSEYYDMPTATRNVCGDLVRVIAGEDGEVVTATSINGAPQGILSKAGDYYDFDQIVDPTVFKEQNGKKFLAVQMAYSQGYLGDPGSSDPFSIVLTPKAQFQKKMIFRTPDRSGATGFLHFGTFICREDSILKIMLNGKPISTYTYAGQLPIPGTNPPMAARRIQFANTSTTYVATCGAPFGCYLYGWDVFESYGHPAGMALGVISPDTLPPLQDPHMQCGNFQVKLTEPRHIPAFSFEDTRIADIAMITDSNDSRWSHASYNYAFQIDPAHPFMPGDSVAYFDLTLIDGSKDAYAAVWTTDKAGNDTVYQYSYTAPRLLETPSAPLDLSPVWATLNGSIDSCRDLLLINQQDSDLVLTSAQIMGVDTLGKFTLSPKPSNVTLHPKDTLALHICFSPTDTLASSDTLMLTVGCIPFKYPLQGAGVIPQIIADDVNFGNVLVGDTVCKPVTITNPGKLPLVINKNWLLNNSKEFSFEDVSRLPVTIQAGKSVTLNFCFHPDTTGPISGRQDWGTNLLAPYQHSIKDTSSLLGFGRQPGLEWDRPTQSYTVQCDPEVVRVNLLNSAPASTGSSISVTKVDVEGADAAEFTIVNAQKGAVPPPSWGLQPGQTDWVDVQFKPDLSKGYAQRNATLVAYGSDNDTTLQRIILLSATVRHSTLRITPTSYDFGMVGQNDPISTTFWIHNDGDTDLVLSNMTVDGGFTLSGFSPGQIVKPLDSVQVTISGNAPPGTTTATLLAVSSASCTPSKTAALKVSSSYPSFPATAHDFGDIFVCQGDSAVITLQNTGTQNAILEKVQIIDTLGTTGANQYSFSNGSRSEELGVPLDTGASMNFKIKFTPGADVSDSAWVVYTLNISSPTSRDTVIMRKLSGTGLHFANAVTARRNDVDTLYTATAGKTISVPIRLKQPFDSKAKVFGVTYSLRFLRDVLTLEQVNALGGLTGSSTLPQLTKDPTDTLYDLLTVKQMSTSRITTLDTVAMANFLYVISDSTATPIEVHDVAFLDSLGNTVCWVTPDNIPGNFQGNDLCGDKTLRRALAGLPPEPWIKSVSPNPTTGSTNIEYGTDGDGMPVTIELYDLLGRRVSTILRNPSMAAGDHIATFDGSQLPSGTYIVRLSSGRFVHSSTLIVGK